jgi:hypothetical protein
MEEAMGRLVKPQEADYALHNATFIAKLPCSTPSAEEWPYGIRGALQI